MCGDFYCNGLLSNQYAPSIISFGEDQDGMYMGRILRKPVFCICENKDAVQLRSICAADQRLCYTPGIYADGYIVFAFPFVRSYVR